MAEIHYVDDLFERKETISIQSLCMMGVEIVSHAVIFILKRTRYDIE
jgi:hypothetical protein